LHGQATDMSALPPPATLASVVSGVTETMLGLTFRSDEAARPWEELVWRGAVLAIPGAQPITVGLSSDQPGCGQLAARMFQMEAPELGDEMLSDALCELVNMTAGLLKSNLKLEQALGLPRLVPPGQPPVPPLADSDRIVLRAEGVGLVLWVFEGIV
jgi:hypothetical protein